MKLHFAACDQDHVRLCKTGGHDALTGFVALKALSAREVGEQITPKLKADRLIDRFGDEPRFLVAAQLAHHMLGAPEGMTEKDAVASFIERKPEIKRVWHDFSVEDLPRLREIYSFIPLWNQRKTF